MSITRLVAIISAVLLLILSAIGIYWSQMPKLFDVKEHAQAVTDSRNIDIISGSYTTVTLIHVAETLLNKPGGFINNDVMPPGVILDNISNWEYGALLLVRDTSRAMRDTFSRSQSQSKEDEDLSRAESRFNISRKSWAFPSAEAEYREGIDSLYKYLMRVSGQGQKPAHFYARADNLRAWLAMTEVRLGNLSQRLGASVGQQRIITELDDSEAQAATIEKTPWLQLDDNFYEARGYAWALIEMLRAMQIDFDDVLAKKNAHASVAQILRELEATQQSLSSPMVLNGSGFGLWANHSLVMASYLSRANAAIIDLRALLEKG